VYSRHEFENKTNHGRVQQQSKARDANLTIPSKGSAEQSRKWRRRKEGKITKGDDEVT
jgi:hypothetical protein